MCAKRVSVGVEEREFVVKRALACVACNLIEVLREGPIFSVLDFSGKISVNVLNFVCVERLFLDFSKLAPLMYR